MNATGTQEGHEPRDFRDEHEGASNRPDFCLQRGQLVSQKWVRGFVGRDKFLQEMHKRGLVKIRVGKSVYYRTDDVIDVLYDHFRKD